MIFLIRLLQKTKIHTILLNSLLGLALLWGPTVSADPLDGEADIVLGQPGFVTNTINNDGADAGTLFSPFGVTVKDAAGNLYVADSFNNRVLIYSPIPSANGEAAVTVLGQADFNSITQNRGNGATPSADSLSFPAEVAVDNAGNIYVADHGNHRVLIYEPSPMNGEAATIVLGQGGDFTTSIQNKGEVISGDGMNFPREIAVNASGNLYVADQSNHRVLIFNTPLTSTTADRVLGQADLASNDPNNGGGNTPNASGLDSPTGVAVDNAGNVYVADRSNHRVLKYSDPVITTGMDADFALGQTDLASKLINSGNGDTATASGLSSPTGVAVDALGNVYVADINHRVLEYHTPQASGEAADVVLGQEDFTSNSANRGNVSPSPSSLNVPRGVSVDAEGNVYVADSFNNRVLIYEGAFETTTTLTCTGYDDPFATALALKKKSKRVIPLMMTLTDSNGGLITDADIEAPPVVTVIFGGQTFGEVPTDSDDLLANGNANDDNIFRFDDSTNQWVYILSTKQFSASGIYTVKVVAGDNSYTIDTGAGCQQTFERLN
jgi:sugar lactone lactonase YvrE